MKGYPISLIDLHRVQCVVVGGGSVAARKVAALLSAQAQVTVISPALHPQLEDLAAGKEIEIWQRPFQQGDLRDAFLVIAATDDPAVNRQVWQEARSQGKLVNVVDDPAHCNFIVPAVVRRGPLTLAISTDGRAPALSRHLRQQLEAQFGPAYGRYVALLGEIRDRARQAVPPHRRRALWNELLNADIVRLLRDGKEAEARQRAEEILSRQTVEAD